MTDEERIKRVEEAVLIMKDLLLRHEGRHDEHDEKLRAFYKAMEDSRENFDFKLNALIDAQIRNESDIAKLKEASQAQLKRIENLENQ